MTTTPTDPPVELVNLDVDEVDGVNGPANLAPFLLIKAVDASTTGTDDGDATETETGTPGDSAWEAADSEAARTAAALLAELKARVDALIDRESSELYEGTGEWSTIDGLADVCAALDFALGKLAAYSFTEAADSAQAAGEEAADDNQITKSVAAVLDALTPGEVMTPDQIRAIAEAAAHEAVAVTKSADTTTETSPAPAAPDAPETGDTSVAKAADTADPAAAQDEAGMAEILKSALEGALKPLADAVKDQSTVLTGLAERVEKMENTPLPGGPLLRGATGETGWALRRGDTPAGAAGTDPQQIAKAIAAIEDPRVRDDVGRALAGSLHPLMQPTT